MQLFHVETNALGVTRQYFSDDKGNITVNAMQDLTDLLDRNKASANDRGKDITSEYATPIGTIPHVIALKWLSEEGWWWMDADQDPDVDRKLKRKLNDPEWRYLRNSELRV